MSLRQLQPGHQFGPYTIEGMLGEGGMGQVYLAHEPGLERKVAIKIIPEEIADSDETIERFKREGRMLAQLNHPNVTTIYSLGTEQGMHYISMEYVEGRSLHDFLKTETFTGESILSFCRQMLEGLLAAHNQHIIHRDIKSQNIILRTDGVVKIADFGIAKSFNEDNDLTKNDEFFCSVHYLSPEIAFGGKFSIQSDIYSLGIVFYEMLTGNPPFMGKNSIHTIELIKNQRITFPQNVESCTPAQLLRIIRRMTEKNIQSRYKCLSEVLEDFSKISLQEFSQPAKKPAQTRPALPTDKVKQDIVSRGYNTTQANVIFEIIAENMGDSGKVKTGYETTMGIDPDEDLDVSEQQITDAIQKFNRIKSSSTVTVTGVMNAVQNENAKGSGGVVSLAIAISIVVLGLFLYKKNQLEEVNPSISAEATHPKNEVTDSSVAKVQEKTVNPVKKVASRAVQNKKRYQKPAKPKRPADYPNPKVGDSWVMETKIYDSQTGKLEKTLRRTHTVEKVTRTSVKVKTDQGGWYVRHPIPFAPKTDLYMKNNPLRNDGYLSIQVIGDLNALFPLKVGKKAKVSIVADKRKVDKTCSITAFEQKQVLGELTGVFAINCKSNLRQVETYYYSPKNHQVVMQSASRIYFQSDEYNGVKDIYSEMLEFSSGKSKRDLAKAK